jgi:hypothetical protein
MDQNKFYYLSCITHSIGNKFNFGTFGSRLEQPHEIVDYISKTLLLYPTFFKNSELIQNCLYCGTLLLKETKNYHKVENAGIPKGSSVINHNLDGRKCKNCNWWFIIENYSIDDDAMDYCYINKNTHEGAICRFPYDIWKKPLKTAEQEIKEYRKRLSDLTPEQIEKLLGEILAQYRNCEVHHVGRARDKGIDLILIKGDETTAVQIKHRSINRKTKSESVVPIRAFVGAFLAKPCKQGIFITTDEKYSNDAKEFEEDCGRNFIPLSLYTVKDIRDFIGNIVDTQWVQYDKLMITNNGQD